MKKDDQLNDCVHRYAVIVAGGSGTRLWPISRKELPKQLQKLVDKDRTLIEDTVSRLLGVIPADHLFISTTENYSEKIKAMLPVIPSENIIIEPIARGTTAAFALFTKTIYDKDPEATIFTLASDHSVTEVDKFHDTITDTFEFVEKNSRSIALVGIKPTRPDTGLGYIKVDQFIQTTPVVYSVEKFVEKPSYDVAQQYLEEGGYFWNTAYYCFNAQNFIEAYNDADPDVMGRIEDYLSSRDIEDYMKVPQKAHEIEFINSNKFPLVIIPADFKWSDIGNWYTLHKILTNLSGDDKIENMTHGEHIDVESENYLVFSTDDKLIATVHLDNIAIINTPDVTLILNKDHPQDIKKVINSIKERGLIKYL